MIRFIVIKIQVPVAEEEEEKNQNTADKNNNSEQTLREEDGDDGEPNSVNENDGYSNERSDDATDENLGEDTSTACLYYRAEIRTVPLSPEVFRGIGEVPDRDKLKIKLFKIYEEAEKEDRKVIDVLINLCVVYTQLNKLPNEETIDYTVEEQGLINNFVDPILSPLLHRPEKEKPFLWLGRMVTKTYNTRPDAGCAIIHERRIERFSCFAGVKAEYKKKDTLSTHQDLLRLALFGMNEIEDNNVKCILLVQVIDK
ncbi:hypothetical protein CU097_004477, partial [Rhizopus azygosporus]